MRTAIRNTTVVTADAGRTIHYDATLLIENRDLFSETQALFEADKPETRTMMLLFASMDEKSPARRPTP
jgi:hypothetical protein